VFVCSIRDELNQIVRVCRLIEQAIEANRSAIALKPDFADAYCNLGSNLKQTGKVSYRSVEATIGQATISAKPLSAYARSMHFGALLGSTSVRIELLRP